MHVAIELGLRVTLVALAALWSMGAAAAPKAHSDIFKTVRAFELEEASMLAPDATLELRDLPPDDPARKRLWRNVPRSEVLTRPRVQRMSIASVRGDRATADATTATRVYYMGVDGHEYSGVTQILSDRLQLRRLGGEWRIISVVRRVRNVGSDAAWHERQARRRSSRRTHW
jgi:hypothetical protein